MHLTCRRQDQSTFEALGFVPDFEQSPDSPVIEMADEQANYAHCNELPTTVPFTAWHSAGSNYGDGRIAWARTAGEPGQRSKFLRVGLTGQEFWGMIPPF